MEATRQLTLFTEAFLNDPVKICQSQESSEGSKGSVAGSGLKCSELFTISDPLGYWLKMSVEQSISPSIPCTPVWSEKVTKSTLTSYQHLRLVRPTKGKDCSLSEPGKMWPTARASDCNGASRKRVLNAEGKAEGPWQLREAVLASGLPLPYAEITTAKGRANGAETD